MNPDLEAREAATRFRAEHHLGDQPLGDLVALIEQVTGIDVAVLDVDPDEHGLTMRDPERGAVYVAVARTPHPMRQRSSLAHELGHVLFEDWSDNEALAERGPVEIRADAFARHLLIPRDGLHEFLEPRRSAGPAMLSQVVQRFLVSPAMATIALHQAGHIDDATKEAWRAITTPGLAARYGWSDQYQALCAESDQPRAPQRLLARAIDGYLAHVVSSRTIATLRAKDIEAVEAELREAGIIPAAPTVAWVDPADLPDVTVDLSDLDDPGDDDTGDGASDPRAAEGPVE